MQITFSLARAGRWFLRSGIQEPYGGVSRYYRFDTCERKPVSTEITGYAASTLVYLHELTGDQIYLDRARNAARFLVEDAWNSSLETFPFEHPSPSGRGEHYAYFFDCGIIVRGLLALWRKTREDRLLDTALTCARSMIADFHSGRDYHPILQLPGKEPVARDGRWSRSPGCYQLKSAMAWWDVAELTGDSDLRDAYLEMLDAALATHDEFLPGAEEPDRVMDRLHAYCYFLEALTPVLDRPDCRNALGEGISTVDHHLQATADSFVRSDVCAQLLRARVFAAARNIAELEPQAACAAATAILDFQIADDENPEIDGGFLFGRRQGGAIPHVNPASTAFALQAVEMWRRFEAREAQPCRLMLI